MIIVTGKPRCGTSLMMYSLNKAGVPLAFDDMKKNPEVMKRYKNPYGFFEGRWDGTDGLIKCFSPNMFAQFPNPRLVIMTRDDKKIQASWQDVRKDLPKRAVPVVMTPERRAELQERMRVAKEQGKIPPRKPMVRMADVCQIYPNITIDYDTFVKTPDIYQSEFTRVFPELDFEIIKSGIDKTIYVER